jgi:hypothetical protein
MTIHNPATGTPRSYTLLILLLRFSARERSVTAIDAISS